MTIEIKNFQDKILHTVKSANLSGAYLRGAYLRDAKLSGADLCRANLSGAYLRDADLSGANLSGADLCRADLRGASLSGAYLRDADLSSAYLRGAYLRDADLSSADLCRADLRGADLSGANLLGADLRHADLCRAILPHFQICPEGGYFRAFKKAQTSNGPIVIELEIAASAQRTSSLIGRKCRASKARVVTKFEGIAWSNHDPDFKYESRKEVYVPNFDPDIRIECTHGIHFFMTRREAEEY